MLWKCVFKNYKNTSTKCYPYHWRIQARTYFSQSSPLYQIGVLKKQVIRIISFDLVQSRKKSYLLQSTWRNKIVHQRICIKKELISFPSKKRKERADQLIAIYRETRKITTESEVKINYSTTPVIMASYFKYLISDEDLKKVATYEEAFNCNQLLVVTDTQKAFCQKARQLAPADHLCLYCNKDKAKTNQTNELGVHLPQQLFFNALNVGLYEPFLNVVHCVFIFSHEWVKTLTLYLVGVILGGWKT